MNWTAYNELAWTEQIMSPPETYKDEADFLINAIASYTSIQHASMLHLGCGAGGHDFHFKEFFAITGVDLSDGMLDVARKTNPEVIYLKGDMRTIKLNDTFDVIAIPDSIMYMSTAEDLKAALINASGHLKSGGILLVVAPTKEDFRENNFVYTGMKDEVHITVFENNHIVSGSTYEAAMIHLIRHNGGSASIARFIPWACFPLNNGRICSGNAG
jgi:SAM-dependent methyltransferase